MKFERKNQSEQAILEAYMNLLRATSLLIEGEKADPMEPVPEAERDLSVESAKAFFSLLPRPERNDNAETLATKRNYVRLKLMEEEAALHIACLERAASSSSYRLLWQLAKEVRDKLLSSDQSNQSL